jgi:hypothetical protein
MISVHDKIRDAAEGLVPIGDSRFATHNIRLSAALCCLGFSLRTDSQPVAVTIDADKGQRIITFFHSDNSENPSVGKTNARDIDLWWNSPAGKYTIDGFDDALTAIRRVFAERERLIAIARFPDRLATKAVYFSGALATSSIHTSSILSACEIKLQGYERKTRKWIFGKGAEVIADMVKKEGKPKERPLSNDLCIDWMLEALRYRDWLAQLVKDPDNIPVIEMRDGEKILQISSRMDEREQRKWISYL